MNTIGAMTLIRTAAGTASSAAALRPSIVNTRTSHRPAARVAQVTAAMAAIASTVAGSNIMAPPLPNMAGPAGRSAQP